MGELLDFTMGKGCCGYVRGSYSSQKVIRYSIVTLQEHICILFRRPKDVFSSIKNIRDEENRLCIIDDQGDTADEKATEVKSLFKTCFEFVCNNLHKFNSLPLPNHICQQVYDTLSKKYNKVSLFQFKLFPSCSLQQANIFSATSDEWFTSLGENFPTANCRKTIKLGSTSTH